MATRKTTTPEARGKAGRSPRSKVSKAVGPAPSRPAGAKARGKRPGPAPKTELQAAAPDSLVANLRRRFGLGRKMFSRLTGFSERALAGWERGQAISEPGLRKMREMERLQRALAEVMQPDYIAEWLNTPSDEFDGGKPLEVIERGETDRVWQMIYYLESGMPV